MGIVSQVGTIQNLLKNIVELGIGGGVTKYIAEYRGKNDFKKLNGIYKTSVSGFALTGFIMILSCTALSKVLAQLILGNEDYYLYIIIAAVAVSLQTQYQVIKRTLQGLLKIKETVVLSISSSVIGVLITLPMIYFFNVMGAVISFALVSGLAFLFAHIYLKRVVKTIDGLKLSLGKIEKSHVRNLLKFGGANSTVFLSNLLTLLAIRSIIINELGAEANGLYQVGIGVASTYLNIIGTSIWQYGMPKVATIMGDVQGIQKLQNQAIRLTLLVLVPIVIVLLISRELWIPLLYSQKFIGAYTLVGWQLLGEFFRSVKWGANIVNQPYERYRFIMLQSLANSVLNLVIFFLLYDKLGLLAAPISYACTHGIMIPIVISVHNFYDKFKVDRANFFLFVGSIILISMTLFLFNSITDNNILSYLIVITATVAWVMVSAEKKERIAFREYVIKKLKNKK